MRVSATRRICPLLGSTTIRPFCMPAMLKAQAFLRDDQSAGRYKNGPAPGESKAVRSPKHGGLGGKSAITGQGKEHLLGAERHMATARGRFNFPARAAAMQQSHDFLLGMVSWQTEILLGAQGLPLKTAEVQPMGIR